MTGKLPLRTATAADLPSLAELVSGSFLHDVEESALERHRLIFEPDRTHLVDDGGRPVGTAAIFTRDMTVPGGVLPTAHVTGVAVATTHRRRGLLRRLMQTQLDSIRERGTEPIAALWASEGGIYGRYGYGIAAGHVGYTINRAAVRVPGDTRPGTLTQYKPADAAEQLAAVLERVRPDRPGWSSRPGKWWEALLSDPEDRRGGMSSLRAVVYQDKSAPDGYAIWSVKSEWDEAGPAGKAKAIQVVAATPEAYSALWRFLLSIDLTRTVTYMFGAVDEPLPFVVTDPQGLVTSLGPSLWLRVVDVPAALSARRYAAPVDVVLDVRDDWVPDNAGAWRLVGDGDSATCERTSSAADLRLDISDLGAIYLGGTSLQTLADAGRVEERRPGAVAAATTAFGWHRAPSAIEIF